MSNNLVSIVINIISSVLYDGGSIPFKMTVSGMSEKNRMITLSKQFQNELSKLQTGNSIIFESDTFVYYLEHMQPIQNICKFLHSSFRRKDVSWNTFLEQLCKETVQYISDKGQSVSVLEQKDIKNFYQAIYNVCIDDMDAHLSKSDRELSVILGQKMEDGIDQILESSARSHEESNRKIDVASTRIEKQIDLLIQAGNYQMVDQPRVSLKMSVSNNRMPYLCVGGSAKTEFVKQVTSGLRNKSWIHIYGKMFCGKTQGLLRVTERVGNYLWLDVQYNKEQFLMLNIDEMLLEEGTVVIVDGIPNIADSDIQNQCVRLWNYCRMKDCRLITSGYEDVFPYMHKYVSKTMLEVIRLNGLEDKEIDEIMCIHNAPDFVYEAKWYKNFKEICGALPAIVMEFIYQLKDKQWVLDDDVFITMINRRTDAESNQMVQLFLTAVPDEDCRRLYYRILYANQPVDASWISVFTNIPKIIADADRHINHLMNRWIYRDGAYYQCPNTMMNLYAEEQLSTEEKRAIDEYLVEVLQQRVLEPTDVVNLLSHYTKLDRQDEVGMLCVSMMEHMIEHDVKESILSPERFWLETPFPAHMSNFVKCMVRGTQINFRVWQGENYANLRDCVEEMMELADKDEMCGILVVVLGIRLVTQDCCAALEIFSYYQAHATRLEEKYVQVYKNKLREAVWSEYSLFAIYSQALALHIDSITELGTFIDYLYREEVAKLQELEHISNVEAIVWCLFERVRKNDTTDIEKYLNLTRGLYEQLDGEQYCHLKAGVCKALLNACSLHGGYDEVLKIYNSLEPTLMAAPLKYIDTIDLCARFAHDYGDDVLERKLFKMVVDHIPYINFDGEEKVFIQSCLLYMGCLSCEDQEEIDKVKDTLRFLAKSLQNMNDHGVDDKLLAEYYIRLYDLDLLENHMEEYIGYIEDLLQKGQQNNSSAVKANLARITHMMGYVQQEYLFDKKLSFIADGSTYAKPKRFMFWNEVDDAELLPYWDDNKRRMLCYLLSTMAQVYISEEKADMLFAHVYEKENYWNSTIEALYYVDAYMQLKLLQLGKYDQLAYMMKCNYLVHDLNGMSSQDRYYTIVTREMFVYSLFILTKFLDDKNNGVDSCKCLLEVINVQQYAELPRKYYTEYCRILGVIVEEEGDYELMKEVFYRVKNNPDLVDMEWTIYPLIMLDTPIPQWDDYIQNLRKIVVKWHYDKDFMIKNIMERL